MKKIKGITSYTRLITGIVVILFCALTASAGSRKNENKLSLFNRLELKKTQTDSKTITKIVTGKVTDSNGEPLVGVSVLEQGSKTGTVTNLNGFYNITVTGDNSVLVFQYIGYERKTEKVGSRTV